MKKYDRKGPTSVQKQDDLLKMLLKVNLHYWMWASKLRHMTKLCGKVAMSYSSWHFCATFSLRLIWRKKIMFYT